MSNPSAAPSLDTLASDYAKALRAQDEGNRAVERVLKLIARCGYTEEALLKEAARLMLAEKTP